MNLPVIVHEGEGLILSHDEMFYFSKGVMKIIDRNHDEQMTELKKQKYDELQKIMSPTMFAKVFDSLDLKVTVIANDQKQDELLCKCKDADVNYYIDRDKLVRVMLSNSSSMNLLVRALKFNQFVNPKKVIPNLPVFLMNNGTICILCKNHFQLLHRMQSKAVSYYYESLLSDKFDYSRKQIVHLRSTVDLLTLNDTGYQYANSSIRFDLGLDGVIKVKRFNSGSDDVYIKAFSKITEEWYGERDR